MMGFSKNKNTASVFMHKLTACISLALLSFSAYGYTFSPEIGVNIKQHSNIARDATNVEDTVVSPYLGFSFRETSSALDANINFQVTHEEYLDDTFSSLDLFDIIAFADWIVVPQRFVWAFDDYATAQRISAVDASRPDNLQTVNVFSTGPDLIFSEGVWSVLGKLRGGNTTYTESDEDSVFYGGSLAVIREINEYSRIATGAIYRINDFDEEALTDYDVGKAFVEYSRDLPAGTLVTGFGASYADVDTKKDDTVPYFKLSLSYNPTGFYTINISATNEFSDDAGRAYNATSSRQVDAGQTNAALGGITQPGIYETRSVSLTGQYSSGLFTLGATGFHDEKSFFEGGRFDVDAGTASNTKETGAAVNASWLLTEKLNLNIGGTYKEIDYPREVFADEDYTIFAGLNYRISRKLFTKLGISREERKSNVATRLFDDDVIFFSLVYKGGDK